jgi:hypothetical protein
VTQEAQEVRVVVVNSNDGEEMPLVDQTIQVGQEELHDVDKNSFDTKKDYILYFTIFLGAYRKMEN